MVFVRPYKRGGWEVDIKVRRPDGSEIRERRRSRLSSKSAAKRWGEARELELLQQVLTPQPEAETERKEAPTLKAFASRFIAEYAEAERQKPSSIAAKRTTLEAHLIPLFGDKKLDEISDADVQQLKVQLKSRAPKTVNNQLTTLSMILKKAVEWKVIDRVPCTIRLLKVPKGNPPFYDFEQYARLVEQAKTDWRAHLIVLLGGVAGLRLGEMMALEWSDIDFTVGLAGQITVARSEWKAEVTMPKGGRIRHVPMTTELAAALRGYRHLRNRRVLVQDDGSSVTMKVIQNHAKRAATRAHVKAGVHILRHTFCSHLAMKGAPARTIQELAGHVDLSTTQRYMHLTPSAKHEAIRLLESPNAGRHPGDDGKNEGNRPIPSGKLVEAAGVEPASESTSSWDSTCVSASEFSCPA
jgi:integrase